MPDEKDPLLLSHYEVLGVEQSSGKDEIRKAFIRLSKEHHPDSKMNGSKSHKNFVRINEAYTVLSKPSSRQIYDASLLQRFNVDRSMGFTVETDNPREKTAWRDSAIWEFRDKSKDAFYKSKPYYGIKGLGRITNAQIVGVCMAFMTVGAIVHYFVIKGSSNKTTAHLNKRDKVSGKTLSYVRSSASANGNVAQLEVLRSRLHKPE